MPKIIEQWLLFKYIGSEFTPLSKPFKTKEQAEKARQKYAERERRAIGLGHDSNRELTLRRTLGKSLISLAFGSFNLLQNIVSKLLFRGFGNLVHYGVASIRSELGIN
jgi:hypothetical protein